MRALKWGVYDEDASSGQAAGCVSNARSGSVHCIAYKTLSWIGDVPSRLLSPGPNPGPNLAVRLERPICVPRLRQCTVE